MADYTLKHDEVRLFKGSGTLRGQDTAKFTETVTYELILTNQNIVIIKTISKMFSKPRNEVSVYPVETIKVYNGEPQVKQNRYDVEVFLTTGEIRFGFSSTNDAHSFVDEVFLLITGKSASDHAADRAVNKVKKGIGRADDALGISTVGTVKTVLENGIARTLLGGFAPRQAKMSAKQIAAAGAIDVAKNVLDAKVSKGEPEAVPSAAEGQAVTETVADAAAPTNEQIPADTLESYSQKLELVAKMKSLVDAGVLTQEEFDIKKKELLGL